MAVSPTVAPAEEQLAWEPEEEEGAIDLTIEYGEMLDSAPVNTKNLRLESWAGGLLSPTNPNEINPAVSVQLAEGTDAFIKTAGNRGRVVQAENLLASPGSATPEALSALGERMDSTDHPDALVGLVDALAQAGQEPVPEVVNDSTKIRDRIQANIAYARDHMVTAIESERLDKYETTSGGFSKVNALSGAIALGLEGAQSALTSFVYPDAELAISSIARKWLPDTDWTDIFNKRELMAELGRKLRTLPEADFRKAVEEMVQTAEEKTGLIGPNIVTKQRVLHSLFQAINDEGVGNLDQAFHALAFIAPVDAVVMAGVAGVKAATATVNAATGVIRLANDVRRAGTAFDVSLAGITGGAADVATMTTRGAEDALRAAAAGDDAALAARGTTVEAVTGSLILPNFTQRLDELNRPMLDPIMWSDEAAEALKESVRKGLGDHLALRLKDTTFGNMTDDGMEYTATLGSAKGRGYGSQEYATNLGTSQFGAGNFTVVQAPGANQWFIQVKGMAQPGLAHIRSQHDWVKQGHWWKSWFGVEATFKESLNQLRSSAQRATLLGEEAAARTLQPYYALPSWQRAKVNKLIDDGDRSRQWYDLSTARGMLGSDKEAAAYMAYRAMAERSHSMLNFVTRERLVADGFLEGVVASTKMPVKRVPSTSATSFVDASTGASTSVALRTGDEVYELLSPVNGHNFAVVRNGQRMKTANLPNVVVGVQPGFIPRQNKFTHYLMDVSTGRVLRGADSELEAGELLRQTGRANPGQQLQVRLASEVASNQSAASAFDLVKSQGRFYFQQQRGTDVLQGLNGKERVTSVEDGIMQMARMYGNHAGVGRYTDTVIAEANRMVKAAGLQDVSFGLGRELGAIDNLSVAQAEVLGKARQLMNHVETINGIGKSFLPHSVEMMRIPMANSILNMATRLDGVPVVAPSLRWAGSSVMGVADGGMSAIRSATFYAMLGSNVFRNLFTQTSMFFHYPALAGGTKYLLGGGYVKDASLLMTSLAAGKSLPGADELVKLWNRTGLSQGVKGHALTLSLLGGDTRATSQGFFTAAGQTTLNAVRKVGFDAPVAADKVNAFLFSLQRWKSLNKGAMPKTDKEVAELYRQVEKLTLNQNATGALRTERGLLGVATQFLGHQLKMGGRIIGLEDGYTGVERLRMAVYQLGTFGLAGLGLNELLDKAEAESGIKWDARVKEAVSQGVYGTAINYALAGAADGRDDYMDISDSVSPVSFVGTSPETMARLVTAAMTGGLGGLIDSPASGFVGRAADALKFGKFLALEVDAPVDDRGVAAATEFARVFPLGNNILRAKALLEHGVFTNRQGRTVTEGTDNAWLAALAGIQSYNEKELRQATELLYKDYAEADDEAIAGALQEQAKVNASLLYKFFTSTDAAEGNLDISNIAYGHAVMMKSVLGNDNEVRIYHQALMKNLDKLGVSGDTKVMAQIVRAITRGEIRPTKDNLKALKEINAPGAEEAIKLLETHADISNYQGGQ